MIGGVANLSIIITAIDKASGTFRKVGNNLETTGAKMKGIGKSMTMGMTLPLVGLAAASIKIGADFDKSMARVRAVTGTTGKEFDLLKKKAKELGISTEFTARQAAEGMTYLAMAGLDYKDVLTAIPKVLNLATIGQIELGEASDIATDIMTAFGLKATDLDRVMDTMAATITTSNTDITMLGEAMKYVAPVASQLGWTLEETAAATGILSSAGIKSTMAGTTLRNIMMRLTSEAEGLGISIYKSDGKMKSFAEILALLGDEGVNTVEILEAFGARAGPGMMVMMDKGAEGLREYTKEIENSGGAAEKIAEDMRKGSHQTLAEFKSAVEGMMIAINETLMPVITPLIKTITELMRGFDNLSPSVKKIIIIAGILAAALGPVLIVIGMLLPALPFLALAFSPLGIAIVGIIAVIGVLIKIGWDLYHNWDEISAGFKTIITEKFTAIKNFFAGIWDSIKNIFGNAIDWITDKIDKLLGIIEKVKEAPAKMKEKIGGAVSGIGERVGGWISERIPHWQHGGVVPGVGEQLAIVHGGETIIPRGKGLGNLNVYVQGGNYLDREAGEKFAEILGKMLRRELRYQN